MDAAELFGLRLRQHMSSPEQRNKGCAQPQSVGFHHTPPWASIVTMLM